jgi:hypothetical protein
MIARNIIAALAGAVAVAVAVAIAVAGTMIIVQ